MTLREGEDRRLRIAVAATGLLLVALLVLVGLLVPATPPSADGGTEVGPDGAVLQVRATDAPTR